MKRYVTIFIALMTTVTFFGQRGYRTVQNSYRSGNYGYYDGRNNNFNNNRFRYANYSRWYDLLTRRDLKRLRKLERRLNDRIECAWEDGYVSRRESRRINDVELDIDNLLSRYEFYRRRNGRRNFRSGLNGVCR